MSDLLAQTVPLSLAAAISPLVLMGMLALLGGEIRPRLHAIAYAVGVVGMIAVLLAGGLALIGLTQSGTHTSPLASPWFELVTGILLIAFAAVMVRPTHQTYEEKAHQKHRQLIKPNAPLAAYTLLGIVLMITNLSTIVVLIAVLKNVAKADAPLGYEIVALAIVGFITALPATAPLAATLFGGAALSAKVAELGAWTNRNGKYILAVLFLVFGLQDLLKALGY
ncbi:MAG: GAP family protein [Gaiellales bacterium]